MAGKLQLYLKRKQAGDDSMLGELYVGNHVESYGFQCYTLEDEMREVKVPGETAIPAGRYRVLPRTEGGMHPKYKERYGKLHIGMAHLQDVPNFKYVYIHTGNTDDHTEGCLLVGEDYQKLPDGNFRVVSSRKAYQALYAKIAEAWSRDDEVWITIVDPD